MTLPRPQAMSDDNFHSPQTLYIGRAAPPLFPAALLRQLYQFQARSFLHQSVVRSHLPRYSRFTIRNLVFVVSASGRVARGRSETGSRWEQLRTAWSGPFGKRFARVTLTLPELALGRVLPAGECALL